MSNQVNLNGILKSDADFLAKDQTVPQNTSADGDGGSFDLGKTNGSLQVVVEVGSVDIEIADTKAISVKLQQSSDDGDSDAFADLQILYSLTSSGGDTLAAGTKLAEYTLPEDAERYIKAVVTTTDAAAVGKINVFLTYLPR